MLAGLLRAATRLACSGPLQEVLDAVAAEARSAVAARACSLVLFDASSHQAHQIGTSGHGPDYGDHLLQAISQGAPMAAARAFTDRKLVVQDLEKDLADPRWSPLAPDVHAGEWATLVSAPLMDDDRCLGVVSGFFDHREVVGRGIDTFMQALAEHVALAVSNARLIVESRAFAALQERQEFARDLHDSAVQTMFSLTMHARAARLTLEREPSAAVQDSRQAAIASLRTVESMADDVQREMRSLIEHLQPDAAGDLVGRLSSYAAELTRTSGVRVVVEADGFSGTEVDEQEREEVFRILREAINNSVKHADPRMVTVQLRRVWRGADIELQVTDDGRGFDAGPSRPGHAGMNSMIDRAERLGGRLEVVSSPTGSSVTLVLPRPSNGRGQVGGWFGT